MATKLENLPLEIAHFQAFRKYIPKNETLCVDSVKTLLEMGALQISTLFEHALANYCGTEVTSTDEADLSCGADAKLTTVRTYRYGKSYGAPVTGVYTKTGDLLVQCYERKQNKFYYFRIPRVAYCHIPKTSNIEIPFYLDGTPKRENACAVNWYQFECASFEDMCNEEYMA